MRHFAIAAALILAPAMASAQSAAATASGTTPAASIYGPPAPTGTRTDPGVVAQDTVRKPGAAKDSAPVTTRHRGHRRGSYVGMDAGAMR